MDSVRPQSRRILLRLPQLSIEAWLAHAACLTALTLSEVMTARGAIKLRAGHCMTIGVDLQRDRLRTAAGALLTDDSIALDADAGHPCLRASLINRATTMTATVTYVTERTTERI